MRAWLFQDHRQKQRLGDKCPWSVGWLDPEGKRKGKSVGSRSAAERYQRKIEGQLEAGLFRAPAKKLWPDFRKDYESKVLVTLSPGTRRVVVDALNHFEKVCHPAKVEAIKTQTIDTFVQKRRPQRGRNEGDTVSPATINKELRHLKAVLRVAADWGYLGTVPKFRMVREPKKLPRYVTPEHFTAIYNACKEAKRPVVGNCDPADWWKALLVMAYMTGWRISELIALRRNDLDLEAGTAITRSADNKGNRDDIAPLHPVVVDHLRRAITLNPMVFPWFYDRRMLWDEFGRIQTAAGVKLPCGAQHEHTDACHLYGFHDLRRAFATLNAEKLTGDALQSLMRHKSYSTTQRYISVARQLNRAVEAIHVPEFRAAN